MINQKVCLVIENNIINEDLTKKIFSNQKNDHISKRIIHIQFILKIGRLIQNSNSQKILN